MTFALLHFLSTHLKTRFTMPAPPSYYRKGKAKEEEGSDEDEGEMPTADLDDIQKPKGLQNFADAPFGGLCQLYDALESAFRESQKKPGYKGNLIAKFFQVYLPSCRQGVIRLTLTVLWSTSAGGK